MQNLDELAKKLDGKYAYISKSWRNNLEQLSAFWEYSEEIRRLIYTTNPIESFKPMLAKSHQEQAIVSERKRAQ